MSGQEDGLNDAIQEFYEKRGAKSDKPKETYAPSAKRMFPLQNRYISRIKSLNAKGKRSEAKLLQKHHEARLQNASAKTWKIKGKDVDRFQMMKWIVERLAAGDLLKEICNGLDGTPSLQTVFAWREEHPDFRKALDLAKKVQAQFFADEALGSVRRADSQDAKLVKVQHDALMKRAALQSDDFKDKQIIQKEDRTANSIQEMQDQLINLFRNDPGLAEMVFKQVGLAMPTLAPPEGETEPERNFPEEDED